MIIKEITGGFKILFNDKIIIRHTVNEPSIFIGNNALDINMKNGDFKFKDRTKFIPANYISKDDNKINFSDFEINFEYDNQERLNLVFNNLSQVIRINFCASPKERIFGMGEHFTSLNLRGKIVKNWVEEHITRKQIYNKIIRAALHIRAKKWKFEKYRTYFILPSFISSDNYYLSADTDGYASFDFTRANLHTLTFYSKINCITLSQKESMLALASDLCDFKGKMPRLPDWVYDGMIFGIQGGTEVVNKKIEVLQQNNIKVNGIWSQDWCGEIYTFFGKQVFWNWKVDSKLYPNLKNNIEKWGKKGIRFLTYINPYLNEFGDLFQEAKTLGYLVETSEGRVFLTKATSFNFGIIDLTNPDAYQWLKKLLRDNYIKLGIMGWMADFGEYLPTDCKLKNGQANDYHNIWPDLWSKLNREVLEENDLLSNGLFFNRAGYKDNSKYSTLIWNGDQHVDFTDDFGMASAIRASLSLSMSGIGFSHSDIGGYTTVPYVTRSKDLYIRWLEMNAFTPIMRSHEGNKPWKNIQFDSDSTVLELTSKFSNIHANLKPYFMHVEDEYQNLSYPMIRPIFFHYNLYSESAFLVGEDLLVYPVIKTNVSETEVELPSNDWVHLITGKDYLKGKHKIKSPWGTPPVFYKKDSIFSKLFQGIHKDNKNSSA